ncbi:MULTISPECIES: S49 family peptidase [unclassified Pseudovibrio]|uniref:S49 family peptidase n=1 Tax=unclassified Pseudovibrio TaxID=2627060 RepID=UPI0007AE7E59|nr:MULTISPECIES: S49 family peptidase [unclassified Pseudovibrio]KZL02273.1 putative signal peptide peptidase SppA [Pseudovibrio sp. W74]KZL08183.1 putative signal peptide peptidase SppA [Pseudovibrio sp. Ad14]
MSEAFLSHVAQEFLLTPLLVEPTKAQVLASVLGERVGLAAPSIEALKNDLGPQANRFFGTTGSEFQKSGYEVVDRKAIITINGALVNRGAYLNANSGLVSYEGISALMRTAMVDDDVDGVLLDLNSPGGAAVGAFETAALIRELSKTKPVVAHVNHMAASAGYALACGCEEIISIPSGIIGSVGVVVLHINEAEKDKKDGREFTFIHAGASKVDGHSHAALSDAARADLQGDIDETYQTFVSTVANARGLSEEAVRGTEARTYSGEKAIELGLIDATGPFEEALERLSFHISSRSGGFQGNSKMSKPNGPLAQKDDAALTMTSEQVEALKASAYAEGVQAGEIQERERTAGIMGLEEAQGRAALAMVAVEQGLSVDAAKAMLAAAPQATTEPRTNTDNAGPDQFTQHKRGLEANTPDVQPDGGQSLEKPKGGLSQLVSSHLKP